MPDETDEPIDDNEEDVYPYSVFEYLDTEKGHQVATRVLDIIDEVKKATIAQKASYARLEKWLQIGIIGVVIVASTVLTLYDKFSPTIGMLFGTLLGYVFGKRK
ncbi:MAG: hypothetical protein HY203_02750 [Nitrospirae bacterium]|nr:hypothetical protein [Nitrospirota bacterium]